MKQMKFGDCLTQQVLLLYGLMFYTKYVISMATIMILMNIFEYCIPQVDMSKVKLDVLKPWITQKITEILKMEDDVVIDYVNNQLEEKVTNNSFFFIINICKHM